MLNALILADGLAELNALFGVIAGQVKYRFSSAYHLSRYRKGATIG